MRSPPWIGGAITAVALLTSGSEALSFPERRYAPHFDPCPTRCGTSGPNSGNWSAYPNFNKISRCQKTMFYDFNIYDPVDDLGVNHKIHACSSYGPDFYNLPASSALVAKADSVDVNYEIGWWEEGFGLAASGIRSLVSQTRDYLDKGQGAMDRPLIIFSQSGAATMGIYIGQGLQKQALSSSALQYFQDYLYNTNVSTPSFAIQLCGPGHDSTHIFGLMVTSNGTFNAIQSAIRSWANATCLPFSDSTYVSSQAGFITPLLTGVTSTPSKLNNSTLTRSNLTRAASSLEQRSHAQLHVRADCDTIQVNAGDSCASLAARCGISGSDFTLYNSDKDLCANLVPKQHVCCSKGDLPDFRPLKNADGSCATYQVKSGENCGDIAAANSLDTDNLEDFNKKTWGWSGCDRLLLDTIMCLSDGDPPFPAPMAAALCGPQVPGTEKPDNDTDIADLNPCPLNACCDVWGQCGITEEFCVDTSTGAPGTAKANTNGCISNCGNKVIAGSGDGAQRVGYFEGYGLGRECLFQDAGQIESRFTHVHFAFGTLTPDYQVETGDALSTYEFSEFKRISAAKKIISFGGWDFSTNPATYNIFREGVTADNRETMAANIASFVNNNDLDGVDIDWEYPGAPDIPGIPPASKDDGQNYLAFLRSLRRHIPTKSISIAAPSSYWYLKQFPIADISKVVDYIVYMTYDLHGQWDANNANAQEGCANGNCLRSQVNMTETMYSLAMITKAGVDGGKVVVGVTSYGRSFKMAELGCYGPDCLFTGDSINSNAAPGVCTGTAGYIADAEIYNIAADSSRVVYHGVDTTSMSTILVYDDLQWVSYMDDGVKAVREVQYKGMGLRGTTDWASDLENYNDVPPPSKDWGTFKKKIMAGEDPKIDDSRNGNWTSLNCSEYDMQHELKIYPALIWSAMDADDAWADVVRIWQDTDRPQNRWTFSLSMADTIGLGIEANCQNWNDTVCATYQTCSVFDTEGVATTGPAAQVVWNSIVSIHNMYSDIVEGLRDSRAANLASLRFFEDTFAPVPEAPSNMWKNVLVDVVTLGIAAVTGPAFNAIVLQLPYYENLLNDAKDTAMTFIGQSTTLAKDLLNSNGGNWTVEAQIGFADYMNQAIYVWEATVAHELNTLFNGSTNSIAALSDLVADGRFFNLDNATSITPELLERDDTTQTALDLSDPIAKFIFGYFITPVWNISGHYPFIMDTGYGCNETTALDQYLTSETKTASGACYNERQYYIVEPKGASKHLECVNRLPDGTCQFLNTASKFSPLPGVETLVKERSSFGGLSREDLVKGSIATYESNGNRNGGPHVDPQNPPITKDILNFDITTAGYITIPVCSPEHAYQAWDSTEPGSSPNYPCDVPVGTSHCGDSTFVGNTGDDSPSISDCQQIISNIQYDAKTDWTLDVVFRESKSVSASHCEIVFKPINVDGNASAKVGGQDVINLINDAVKQFGADGKVGASGRMPCSGNLKTEAMSWVIQYKK